MKKSIIILWLSLIALPAIAQKNAIKTAETTTYYLIRHAEKDRSDTANKDPHLTKEGEQRAQNWSKVLQHVKFDRIYSTNYNRTKETAKPTALAHDVEIELYDPRNINLENFINITKGKTVLIVGHSNTTPMFTNGLLGNNTYKMIADDNNSNLYIVTITENATTSTLLHID